MGTLQIGVAELSFIKLKFVVGGVIFNM